MLDIVERFTLFLMLFVVAFRNLIELSGSEFDFSGGFSLPKSFGWFRGNNVLWTISYVSPMAPLCFLSSLYSITASPSLFLPFYFLKCLWIGSNTRLSPSSITSDRRYMSVTPMYYVETLRARVPRVGRGQEKLVCPQRTLVSFSSCFTAFIC